MSRSPSVPKVKLPVMRGLDGVHHFGTEKADYWSNGVYAKEDYRYWAMYEYLKLSPSFVAVQCALRGRVSPYPLPPDEDAVATIANDFSMVDENLEPWQWWRKQGKYLFGTEAPKPTVTISQEILTSKKKSISVMWDKNDAIVARIALGQTRKDALRKLSALMERFEFSRAPSQDIGPKYTFMVSKIRQSTLALGVGALSYYKMRDGDLPLWWIGNAFNLIPGQCFTQEQLERLDPDDLAYRKRLLTIAASRLIRSATLIAENAARGRFPCASPFPEAQTQVLRRKMHKLKNIGAAE